MHVSVALILIPLAVLVTSASTQPNATSSDSPLFSALTNLDVPAIASATRAIEIRLSSAATQTTGDPLETFMQALSEIGDASEKFDRFTSTADPALLSSFKARASAAGMDFDELEEDDLDQRAAVIEQTAGVSETPFAFGGAATVTPTPSFPEPSAAKQEFPDALLETSTDRISVATSSVSKTDDPRVVHTSRNGAVVGTALPVAAVGAGWAVLGML